MKLIDAPSLEELKQKMYAPIIGKHDYMCGFPFVSVGVTIRRLSIRLLYGSDRYWTRQIDLVGLRTIGISSQNIICFKSSIDFDSSDLELDTPKNPLECQFYKEVIEYLAGQDADVLNVLPLSLDVLIYVDLLSEEAIMIADDGRYDDPSYEDDMPF